MVARLPQEATDIEKQVHEAEMELAKFALKIVLGTLDHKNDNYCLAGLFAATDANEDQLVEKLTVTSLKLGPPKGCAEKDKRTTDM